MIQPQELRIGNYVDVFDKIDEIKSINENEHGGFCKFKNNPYQYYLCHNGEALIKPIPLTEEILFKFGFEKIKSDEYPHKYIINKYMSDEVEIENLNSQNCFIFSHGKKFSSIKIEYVHQLQNLYFSLTGKELVF